MPRQTESGSCDDVPLLKHETSYHSPEKLGEELGDQRVQLKTSDHDLENVRPNQRLYHVKLTKN